MAIWVLEHDLWLRLGVFVGAALIFVSAELLWPKRKPCLARMHRWLSNFLISVCGAVLLRLAATLTASGAAIGAAIFAANHDIGMLQFIAAPLWAELIIAIIILDLAIYAQHVATHKFPLLWALHKVHHADRDIDASTGIRFHPLEIALSMVFKMAVICAIGASAIAVLIFEIALNGFALFNHANIRLPKSLDAMLRLIIVTPDMHRVHHSTERTEQNRNFGFSVPYWDWLFRTYQAQPSAGHNEMSIGLAEHQSSEPASLWWSLFLPFRR